MDIEKFLEQMAPEINRMVEKYLPRKYDGRSLEFALGTPRYRYSIDAANQAVAKPAWDLLDRGGKRWRPALMLMVIEALGKKPEDFLDFAALCEIVHNGSLICDDLEDNSDLRRGKPCIHKIYGNDVAVNAGNAMYFIPLLVFLKSRLDDRIMLRAFRAYSQELINIHFGQATDIAWHNGLADADSISEDEYMQMCAYKTGTLARLSARLGAILAGADERLEEKLGRLAESIGIAFQIQDDILNLTAAAEKTFQFTKEYIGSDITEGKRSLLVIHTLKTIGDDKIRLLEILKMHTKDHAVISEAIEIIKKYGAIDYAKNKARELVRSAWSETDALLGQSEAKERLKAFADFLVEREF